MENVGKTRKNDGNMLRNSWESDGEPMFFGVFFDGNSGAEWTDTVDDFT